MKNFFIYFKKKGYENLKRRNKLSEIEEIKYNFEIKFKFKTQSIKNDYNYKVDKRVLKLSVLNNIFSKRFNEYILFSYGLTNSKTIFFPAPYEILEYVISLNKFSINKKISLILWQIIKIKYLIISLLEIFKLLKNIFFDYEIKYRNKYDKIYYFSSLGDGNFDFNEDSYNVFTWFKNNFSEIDENKPVLIIHSNFKKKKLISFKNIVILFKKYPFFVDNILKKKISITYKFIKVYKYNLIKFFYFKNDLNIIFLKEHLIYLSASAFSLPYNKCFFNNSDYLSRPYWTYLKNIDTKIFFYFYSINYFKFYKNKFSKFSPGYQSMLWSNYIFWNKTHESHFDFFNKKDNLIIEEPVSFSDNSKKLIINIKYKKIISLFNVQPLKYDAYIDYCLYGIDDYYNEKNCIDFYEDLITSITHFNENVCILLKEKRKNDLISYKYQKLISKLLLKKNIIRVDEDFSVYKMINKSDLVISLPFSSTSVFAHSLGKLSYYYDPTGYLIQKNSPFNIKIINKKTLYQLNEI